MTIKSKVAKSTAGPKPTPPVEKSTLENMQATKAEEAIDEVAAEKHPRKGDVDRPGFDLGGMDGEPIDAGLRAVEAPDQT